MINVLSLPHQVTRLEFDTGQPYEKFRGRYEAIVPAWLPRHGEIPGRHARHADTGPDVAHGFFLYWRAPMTTGTEPRPCTAYLMGSPAIVETSDGPSGSDPAVMLGSLLRTLIYIGSDDRTKFVIDQPSSELDEQLGGLLEVLGITADPVLDAAATPAITPMR
jgi:hypothetical protein